MHNAIRRYGGILLALAILAPLAGDQKVVLNYPKQHAVVDWTSGYATVEGYAPLSKNPGASAIRKAQAAALASARQNVVALAGAIVPIAGDNQRRKAMDASVRQLAGKLKAVSQKRLPNDRYQVTLRVPLLGKNGLSGVLSPHLRRKSPFVPAKKLAIASRDLPSTTGEEDLLTKADATGPFTGLIVDARGFGVQNSMSPVVYDPANKPLYSGSFADADYVEDVGVVGYMGSIKAAMATPRVGKNPLVLRAAGTPDQFKRCVSLTAEDAARLLATDKAAGFLKKCAVTFVIDK